jgi:putative flippase GtrA
MTPRDKSDLWGPELAYIVRYAGSGLVNTAVGFFVIGLAMIFGLSPIMSNITGYAVGFFFGFILSKRFVFRSDGRYVTESFRYVIAFVVSFVLNLIVLRIMTTQLGFNAIVSQLVATATYTVLMFALTRFFVFRLDKPKCGAN